MSGDLNDLLLLLAIVAFGIFTLYRFVRFLKEGWHHRLKEDMQAKAEAMFQAQFPELQPHFHPRAVARYTLAYHQRRKLGPIEDWQGPPGFSAARLARIRPTGKGEQTVLIDEAGGRLAEFLYNRDDRPDVIATLRLGEGKFTVRQAPKAQPVVKYWHPAREFTWKGEGLWSFKTPVADEPISSDSNTVSWSDSSSSNSTATRAAGVAAFAGAGGAFDGGGAAHGWDEAPAAQGEGGHDGGAVAADGSTNTDAGASESSTAY